MRWTFIGAGNMASSLIGGLINDGTAPNSVQVLDVDAKQQARVKERFGVNCIGSTADIGNDDAVVIAVKPDKVRAVCESFTHGGKTDNSQQTPALFVSVAAGVTAEAMEHWLPANTPIIRTMPNTPALLGLGATALCANAACAEEHRQWAEQLMKSAGITVWVDNESQIQSATELGLSQDSAEKLAIQTAVGAATMARDAGNTPAELRQNVTSKGGTTHAAVTTFDQHELPATVKAAMQAAYDRAVELGTEFGDS